MSITRVRLAPLRLGTALLIGVWILSSGHPFRATAFIEASAQDPIVVTTSAELEAALSPSNAGRHIWVRAGTYDVSHALQVPDYASVIGESQMIFDAFGLPQGFDPLGRTVLRSTAGLVGDMVTLGNGATLQGLSIEDFPGRIGGNLIVVYSRSPGDFVSAAVVECEMVNPNPPGIALQGPRGRALVAITRNLNLGSDPPPHEGAVVSVQMTRSIIRAPGGGTGVFAINFASGSQVTVSLTRNVIGGGLTATGGVSRPDGVESAETVIESEHNVFRSDSAAPDPVGWLLLGGTDAPFPGLVSEGANFNSLRVRSVQDRIGGFATAIAAAAGRRSGAVSGTSSGNHIELKLLRTDVQSLVADFVFFGAQSLVNSVAPGDGNGLRVLVRGARGSGARSNQYAHSWPPLLDNLDQGNWLEIVGSPAAFTRTNAGVDPAPANEFFTTSR